MYCGYLSLDITIFEWECSHVLSTVENSAVMRTCPALGPRHRVGTHENLHNPSTLQYYNYNCNYKYITLQLHHITITISTLQATRLAPTRFCTTRQNYNITITIAITNTSHYNYITLQLQFQHYKPPGWHPRGFAQPINITNTLHYLNTSHHINNPQKCKHISTTTYLFIYALTSSLQKSS